MTIRIRKEDREQIEAVLSQEADMDHVVEAVFTTVSGLLMDRDWYMLITDMGVGQPLLYGPYESESVAKRVAASMVAPGPEPGRYSVHRIRRTVTG